jgi:hypothetical protein
MVEWQINIVNRFKNFLKKEIIYEPQLLAFEKKIMADTKSPQIVDFVKTRINKLKSTIESGKVNINKCKELLNIQNQKDVKGKNKEEIIHKPNNVKQFKSKTKSNLHQPNTGKNKRNFKTEKLINLGQSNKFISDIVIGKSLNMVAAYVGITETMLKIYLESKNFEITYNEKFTKEMWHSSDWFLIENYEEKEMSKLVNHDTSITPRTKLQVKLGAKTYGKPGNYFKLILIRSK